MPGIRGLLAFRPETAKPLCELAEVLLHAPGTLTTGERELIATYVSFQNDCYYCQTAHGAIVAHHLGGNEQLVVDVKRDFASAAISDKLKALLSIAGKVQRGGKKVETEDVERARELGLRPPEKIQETIFMQNCFGAYSGYGPSSFEF